MIYLGVIFLIFGSISSYFQLKKYFHRKYKNSAKHGIDIVSIIGSVGLLLIGFLVIMLHLIFGVF